MEGERIRKLFLTRSLVQMRLGALALKLDRACSAQSQVVGVLSVHGPSFPVIDGDHPQDSVATERRRLRANEEQIRAAQRCVAKQRERLWRAARLALKYKYIPELPKSYRAFLPKPQGNRITSPPSPNPLVEEIDV